MEGKLPVGKLEIPYYATTVMIRNLRRNMSAFDQINTSEVIRFRSEFVPINQLE